MRLLPKLLAVAALLVPLGVTRAEASSITCTFSDSSNCFSPTADTSRVFDFRQFGDGYWVTLTFANVGAPPFQVTIEDEQLDQIADAADLAARFGNFADHVCVPIADAATTCVVFHVSAPPRNGPTDPGTDTWFPDYVLRIGWEANTNPQYPGNLVHMLHALGSSGDEKFDKNITVPGSYTTEPNVPPPCVEGPCSDPPPCLECSFDLLVVPKSGGPDDPEIAGTDDNFQSFVVAAQTVPEPASLLLLGSGMAALLRFRRRRQR